MKEEVYNATSITYTTIQITKERRGKLIDIPSSLSLVKFTISVTKWRCNDQKTIQPKRRIEKRDM